MPTCTLIHSYSLRSLFFSLALGLLSCSVARGGEQTVTTPPPPPPAPQQSSSLLSFWEGRLVFDIEERVRGEARENTRDFDSSNHDDNDDSWLLNRFRLGLAVKPVSWLKLYGQTQDSREAFSDRANIPGIHGAEGTDTFDLRQAYVSLGDPHKFPLVLTVGRQSLDYGDRRLIADSQWGNFGRTYDTVRVRFEEPHYWIEAFALRPVEIRAHDFNSDDSADNLFGAYLSTDAIPVQTTDFYVFYRDKSDNQPDLDPTNKIDPEGSWDGPAARYVVIGTRIKSNPKALHGWDYNGEATFEAGDLYATDLNSTRYDLTAFAVSASGGYTAKSLPWKPRAGLEYNFASGDDNPNDTDSHSFQNLFPSNHGRFGIMDEFGWRNLHEFGALLSAKPTKSLELETGFHALWLADTADYWYRSNGISTLRTKTPDGRDVRTIGASNFAGEEIDLVATYNFTRNIKLQAGYSHFFAGDYLADTGPSSDADFAYVMTTFSF